MSSANVFGCRRGTFPQPKNIPDDKSENSVSDTPIEDKKFCSRGFS